MTKHTMKDIRDDLRKMFLLWHKGGPHATRDAPVIERAILFLDEELVRRAEEKS